MAAAKRRKCPIVPLQQRQNPRILIQIDIDSDVFDAATLELSPDLLEVGKLPTAWSSAREPESQQNDFPPIILE
jgi:hypothetical protein